MPYAMGIATALLILWVWGSLSPVAVTHDEAAYVLQARIFASGRWIEAARFLPEFFEQMAVLVTPVLAPKMPPGHAILMIPGVWLGLPGLTSVVLGGIAGGLVFALARRVSGAWVALLTWFIWVSAPGVMMWRAAYFSETTTSALWLGSWWAVLEWRETGRRRWLLMLAACIGWGAITRPLTMLAFAISIAPLVVWTVAKRREWGGLVSAMALGTAILAILPLWSRRTTGDAWTTPLAVYTRTYTPWDVPGFGLDSTPPTRSLPSDLAQVATQFGSLHAAYTPRVLPGILADRAGYVMGNMWSGWRRPLALFALIGLALLPAEGAVALASACLLVLSYAIYAHSSNWSLYYVEMQPVLAFLTALGASFILNRLARLGTGPGGERLGAGTVGSATSIAILLALLMITWPAIKDLRETREWIENRSLYQRYFRELTKAIPAPKSIVFVRYGPKYIGHSSLVRNVPDLESADTWVVYDRGAENTRLLRLAPNRVPYLFDAANLNLVPLMDSGAPPPGH